MYRKLPGSSGNVLGYAIEDEIAEQDVAEMQADIKAAIVDHGDVRLLVHAQGFDEFKPAAVWQDLAMLEDYAKDVERIAVIGDAGWLEWGTAAGKIVSEAKHFDTDEVEAAWTWLRS